MEVENQIQVKVKKFFDWINHPIIKQYYIKDLQNWNALCASLHILNDLKRPKIEYYNLDSINYLEAIGIMQTLYIEQDTVQTLRNALLEDSFTRFKLSKYNKIRDTRNKVFGHPSDKKSGSIKTRHFFDIKDDKEQVIKHIYWGTPESIDSKEFNISNIVLDNSKITFAYLIELETKFIDKFKGIMAKYSINLDSVFKNAGYTFEKLLTKENDHVVINTYKETVDDEVLRIKIGLQERNIYESFEQEIMVIEFLSSKLKALFHKQTYNDIEFYTYASTLCENISKLEKRLKEIDKL